MGKAILVMDMPGNCKECPCGTAEETMTFDYYCCCQALEREIEEEKYSICVPNWCPLKEFPERKDMEPGKTVIRAAQHEGWNTCLDEILKERD